MKALLLDLDGVLYQGEHAIGLPGIYKIGGWYATTDFPDQHFGTDSTGAIVSLGVDPTADPIQHRGNWGIYAIADQMVWRQADTWGVPRLAFHRQIESNAIANLQTVLICQTSTVFHC